VFAASRCYIYLLHPWFLSSSKVVARRDKGRERERERENFLSSSNVGSFRPIPLNRPARGLMMGKMQGGALLLLLVLALVSSSALAGNFYDECDATWEPQNCWAYDGGNRLSLALVSNSSRTFGIDRDTYAYCVCRVDGQLTSSNMLP
jgi:hypothetical protein